MLLKLIRFQMSAVSFSLKGLKPPLRVSQRALNRRSRCRFHLVTIATVRRSSTSVGSVSGQNTSLLSNNCIADLQQQEYHIHLLFC